MTIRQRIVLLILVTFAALAAIGGFSIFQSHASAERVKSVTESVVPSALGSADLVGALKDVQQATMAMVFAPDNNLVLQSRESLFIKENRLKDGLSFQAGLAENERQKGLVMQARESMQNYFASIQDTLNFKLAGQQELAQASLFATVSEYQQELEQIVQTMRVEKNRSKDEAIADLNNSLQNTITLITVVTLLTFGLLVPLGIVLYRRVVMPIGTMQVMMTDIATSQDFSRRLPVEQTDEVGCSIVAFNTMIEKIELSTQLVRKKTNDMQTMLEYMPQGVLTIGIGGIVHAEYSSYLESILETKDIAGRDIVLLIFEHTSLGANGIAQVDAAIGACLGEDAMNFEFNEHLLIGEVEFQLRDGRVKVLDLNWSPIIDDSEVLTHLLLCVRDVTEVRKLAAEAHQQRRQLEMIGEILGVSQEKFFEFTGNSIVLIDENEQLIRQHPSQESDVIHKLFRNMHTVKGNARTYGLSILTNVVHEAEQTYDKLRKLPPQIVWDQTTLLDELAKVKATLEQYCKINEVSLGRKGPGRRGNSERYLLVEKNQIEDTLHRLESVNTANIHELLSARDTVRKTLRLLGTETLGDVLSGVLGSLPSLAAELCKLPPIIEIADNDFVVKNHASGLLKNVFMHLVRNSLDHGIEKPSERFAANKAAAGTISISLNVEENKAFFAISDDGQGLALSRIQSIAVERGLLEAGALVSDEEIAAQIFRPGFSTAKEVTQVSGRGVGMDAVVSFVQREGGSVHVRFLDAAEGAAFRAFAIVVSLPANLVVHVDQGISPVSENIQSHEIKQGVLQYQHGSDEVPAVFVA